VIIVKILTGASSEGKNAEQKKISHSVASVEKFSVCRSLQTTTRSRPPAASSVSAAAETEATEHLPVCRGRWPAIRCTFPPLLIDVFATCAESTQATDRKRCDTRPQVSFA